MIRRAPFFGLVAAIGLSHVPTRAVAEQGRDAGAKVERFVIIVANNGSYDDGLEELQFADDDGLLYAQLFENAGAHVTLLAGVDDETQSRLPSAAAQSIPPTRENLQHVLDAVYHAVEAAPADRQVDLLFVYVGHGNVDDEGRGYVYLEDGHFTRADLFAQVIARSPATFTHIIVDACHAYSLVAGRGPGDPGPVDDFLSEHDLAEYPTVGALVATSDDRETREWSRIRAGVFSHQVRSALAVAADVNNDGAIEYSEVAAFVEASNAGLQGLGKRISTFAWAPSQNRRAPLLTYGGRSHLRGVLFEDATAGRFSIENELGQRVAELNKPTGQTTLVMLPSAGAFFVRDGSRETVVSGSDRFVAVTQPLAEPVETQPRGAMDRAFESGLFAVPFGEEYYRGYVAAREGLAPVDFASDGELIPVLVDPKWLRTTEGHALGSARDAALRVGLTYGVAPAVFRRSKVVEHGAYLTVAFPLAAATDLVGTAELTTANLRPKREVDLQRAALSIGIEQLLWSAVGETVGLTTSGGLGAGQFWIEGEGGQRSDTRGPLVRLAVGGFFLPVSGLRLQLVAGATGYAINTDNGQTYPLRPLALVGASWTFGGRQ